MSDYKIEDYKSKLSYRVRYISGMHASETSRSDYHSSLNLIFIFFIKGRAKIKIEGASYDINEGDIILLNPSEFFVVNIDDNCFHERIVLLTNMKMIKSFPCDCSEVFYPFYKRKTGVGNIILSDNVKKYNIDKLFYELLEIMHDKSDLSKPLSICKIVEILCVLHKTLENVPSADIGYVSKNTMIDKVLNYIDKNLTKDITIQDVARHVNVHKSYLSHKFKEQMGVSIWTYLVQKRIYKFNGMINDSSIEEAAYSVGFKNYSNFFRLYKKYMGISPTEFKKQSRENNH